MRITRRRRRSHPGVVSSPYQHCCACVDSAQILGRATRASVRQLDVTLKSTRRQRKYDTQLQADRKRTKGSARETITNNRDRCYVERTYVLCHLVGSFICTHTVSSDCVVTSKADITDPVSGYYKQQMGSRRSTCVCVLRVHVVDFVRGGSGRTK